MAKNVFIDVKYGSNANDGLTPQTAKRTMSGIDGAFSILEAGDTLIYAEGVYCEWDLNPPSGGGNITIDQSQTADDIDRGIRTSSTALQIAQSFIAGANRNLAQVNLRLVKRRAPAGYFWIEIRKDNNDSPGELIAQSYKRYADDISPAPAEYTFKFDWGVSLTAGQKYWIVIDASYAISNKDYIAVRLNSEGGYANGTAKQFDGTSWVDLNQDFYFVTYYFNDYPYITFYGDIDGRYFGRKGKIIIQDVGNKTWIGGASYANFYITANKEYWIFKNLIFCASNAWRDNFRCLNVHLSFMKWEDCDFFAWSSANANIVCASGNYLSFTRCFFRGRYFALNCHGNFDSTNITFDKCIFLVTALQAINHKYANYWTFKNCYFGGGILSLPTANAVRGIPETFLMNNCRYEPIAYCMSIATAQDEFMGIIANSELYFNPNNDNTKLRAVNCTMELWGSVSRWQFINCVIGVYNHKWYFYREWIMKNLIAIDSEATKDNANTDPNYPLPENEDIFGRQRIGTADRGCLESGYPPPLRQISYKGGFR